MLHVDLDLGNNRLRKFASDADAHKEYAYLFHSIKLDNLERALNFINEKYEADAKALVQKAEQLEGEDFQREKVTLDWLNQMAKHLARYIDLAKDLSKAQLAATSGEVASEPNDWAGYSAYHRETLIVDILQHSVGSVMLDAPGAFEVEGHGMLVVRVEYGADSSYFIVSGDEPLLSVKDLREVVAN